MTIKIRRILEYISLSPLEEWDVGDYVGIICLTSIILIMIVATIISLCN